MDDLKRLALEILDQGYLVSLATVDDGGPWVSDVVFAHDDNLVIYWASSPQTRHSQAIAANSSVAATVTISNAPGEQNAGLQLAGTATAVTPPEAVLERYAAKRQKPTAQTPPGHQWYALTPSLIDVIHEPSWGYQKKTIKN